MSQTDKEISHLKDKMNRLNRYAQVTYGVRMIAFAEVEKEDGQAGMVRVGQADADFISAVVVTAIMAAQETFDMYGLDFQAAINELMKKEDYNEPETS